MLSPSRIGRFYSTRIDGFENDSYDHSRSGLSGGSKDLSPLRSLALDKFRSAAVAVAHECRVRRLPHVASLSLVVDDCLDLLAAGPSCRQCGKSLERA